MPRQNVSDSESDTDSSLPSLVDDSDSDDEQDGERVATDSGKLCGIGTKLGVPGVLRLGALCSGLHPEKTVLDKMGIPCKTIWSVEKNANVRRLQEAIHGRPVDHYDVFKLNVEELDPVDVLTAGFPCQPFSGAGKGLGVKDAKGRGLVAYEVVKIIRHTKPRLAILENVKGLLTRHRVLLMELKRDIEKAGYKVSIHLYNGKNSIIPQSRPRVWILCIRRDSLNHIYKDFAPLKFRPALSNGYIGARSPTKRRHFSISERKTMAYVRPRVLRMLKAEPAGEVVVDIGSTPESSNPNFYILAWHRTISIHNCKTLRRTTAKQDCSAHLLIINALRY